MFILSQVLNMRPKEILGMVEEAAGTRMFEERKDKAKKTMGKKEKRVDEITALLTEEITPKLDTLRTERRAYMQYQKAGAELERLARVLRAYEWHDHRAKASRKDAQITEREREVAQARRDKDRATGEAGVAETNRVDVQTQRDRELKKGGKITRMEEAAKELEKAVVKLRTQAEIKEGTIKDEEVARDASARELSEVRVPPLSFSISWLTCELARSHASGEKSAGGSCHRRVQRRQGKTHHDADGAGLC
jgi:structural maintenance of chromosome 2